jgi:putative transposase
MNILALLQPIQPIVSNTDLRRFSRIARAMLCMVGRVTMLGLSRWAGNGGSYRTVQRFFNTLLPWTSIFDSLRGVSRRKRFSTTQRAERARPAPDRVNRDFQAAGPDRLWVADITYISTWGVISRAIMGQAFAPKVGQGIAAKLGQTSSPKMGQL